MKNYHPLIIAIALISACSSNPDSDDKNGTRKPIAQLVNSPEEVVSETGIIRPLKDIDVKTERKEIEVSKGGKITFSSGASLDIPANAFVDSAGNLIKGKVDIQYKQYNDALDFFISGIPMHYDSAGVDYMFESAAMCDIRAFQNGNSLELAKDKQIGVDIPSKNGDPKQNLYRLNDASGKWEFIGKPDVVKIKSGPAEKIGSEDFFTEPYMVTPSEQRTIPKQPWLPAVSSGKPKVVVPANRIPKEVQGYQNLNFEIYHYPPDFISSPENWVFTGTSGYEYFTIRSINKDAWAELKATAYGQNWVDAFKQFLEREIAYQRVLDLESDERIRILTNESYAPTFTSSFNYENWFSRVLSSEQFRRRIYEQYIIDFEYRYPDLVKYIERTRSEYYRMTEKREAKLSELAKKFSGIYEKMEARLLEEQKKQDAKVLKSANSRQLTEIVSRNFNVSRLGTYNCDQPIFKTGKPVNAIYVSNKGEKLYPATVSVGNSAINGILEQKATVLTIDPKIDQMMFTVIGGKLAYLTYEGFRKTKINFDSPTQFTLTIQNKSFESIEEIRDVIGL